MNKKLIVLIILFSMFPSKLFSFEFTPVKFLSVVNGNTINVMYEGKKQAVRLISVDIHKRQLTDKDRNNPDKLRENRELNYVYDKEAVAYMKNLIGDKKFLLLEIDKVKYSADKKLLAYVWIDLNMMLNLKVVQSGYGKYRPATKNVNYRKILLEEEKKAKDQKKGLWSVNKTNYMYVGDYVF